MTCPNAPRLGAIALGAEDRERHDLENHLLTCSVCRAELDELREVSALLRLVDVEDVIAPVSAEPKGAPDDLLGRVLAVMAAESAETAEAAGTANTAETAETAEREARPLRRRRARLLVAVAAAVVFGLGGAGVAISGLDSPAVRPVELPVASSKLGVSATTSLLDQPWGTRIEMGLRGLPDGSSCRLVAVARDGGTETVAAWHVNYEDSFEVEAMTSIRTGDLAGLQVVDQSGRRLIDVAVTAKEGPSR